MSEHTIYADFQNADSRGRLRLNCVGTIQDLAEKKIILHDGLRLTLHDEELETEGNVQFSTEEHLWVAEIDWNALRHCSDI